MANLARIDAKTSWGPDEQAAFDRCLSVPGLSPPSPFPTPPIRYSRTVEAEIIPRLMLAHRVEAEAQRESRGRRITSADVGELARQVLQQDVDVVLKFVATIRARGHDLESVFLDLFGPTARLLGDLWTDDLCSFTDVTIGLSRLQSALRQLSDEFEAAARPECNGRILLASTPGEQHSLGLSMLEAFFRRAGWDVRGGAALSRSELVQLAREDWIDVLGISLSSATLYRHVQPLIVALRKASQNPSLLVMVGGQYFLENPGHADEVGADAIASNAPDALRRAEEAVGLALSRR